MKRKKIVINKESMYSIMLKRKIFFQRYWMHVKLQPPFFNLLSITQVKSGSEPWLTGMINFRPVAKVVPLLSLMCPSLSPVLASSTSSTLNNFFTSASVWSMQNYVWSHILKKATKKKKRKKTSSLVEKFQLLCSNVSIRANGKYLKAFVHSWKKKHI